MNFKPLALAALAAVLSGLTSASHAQATPQPTKPADVGRRAQVLVLGSAHLAQLSKPLPDSSLQAVIDRLVRFRPDIVAVEDMPGESCDTAARHPATYDAREMAVYCPAVEVARRSTGLEIPDALAQLNQRLARLPANPDPALRRRLVATAMAAGESATAALHWRRLPTTERHAGDGIDADLAAQIAAVTARTDETMKVAVPVALQLSLPRLHAIDDHSGDNVQVTDAAAYGRAIQAAWDGTRALARPMRDRQEQLLQAGDGIGLYRHLNAPSVLHVALQSDFAAAAAEPSPEQYGRIYVAGWETRNLRMAANIRATFRERPDARVLVIVGSSHKPMLERLLGAFEGVEIVDALNALH